VAAVGTIGTSGYTQPADQVQPETSNRRLEGGQGGENRARHHERGYPPEPGLLGTPRSLDKVQLRIYDTDKLAADNLAACPPYEPPSDDELEHEEATLTGYVSTDSELTGTRELCSPGHSGGSFCKLTCITARQHPLPSSPAWQHRRSPYSRAMDCW